MVRRLGDDLCTLLTDHDEQIGDKQIEIIYRMLFTQILDFELFRSSKRIQIQREDPRVARFVWVEIVGICKQSAHALTTQNAHCVACSRS